MLLIVVEVQRGKLIRLIIQGQKFLRYRSTIGNYFKNVFPCQFTWVDYNGM